MLGPPKIVVADLEVILSGSVIALVSQAPLVIYPVASVPEPQYFVKLIFDTQKDRPGEIKTIPAPDGDGVEVTLTNFDNALGAASSQPIGIANWQGRTMFLSITCHRIGQDDTATRLINYTFYLGGPNV